MTTNASVAARLITDLPTGVFAHAAQAAVIHQDFTLLKRMLPGVEFATNKIGPEQWTLAATCADGSSAVWNVGG